MAERSKEQILDQAVFAVQCVSRHYGSGFSEEGLQELRKLLNEFPWWTDACYSCDVYDDDPYADFDKRIIWPYGWWKEDFKEIVEESKGE